MNRKYALKEGTVVRETFTSPKISKILRISCSEWCLNQHFTGKTLVYDNF